MSEYMREALQLAEQGRGSTAPNPMVGCLIVRDGKIVGRGWHERAGEPHAERYALQEAGEAARGATVYVTLEPCSHFGRTPPCADALIEAGVRTVHVAMLDPNPLVAGRGIRRLREAGIEVTVGTCEREARQLNEIFVHYITTRRPFVIAKWAMTLDGKIATRTGHARWISGPASREHAHRQRHEVSAILVGRGTALADNPRLTTRLPEQVGVTPRHPVRVVLDSRGTLPLNLALFDPSLPGRTIVATTERAAGSWQAALEQAGIEVWRLPAEEGGLVALPPLLDALGQRELSSLLVEGGGEVHAAFLSQGLVNRVHAYIAPKLVGGKEAPGPLGGPGATLMDEAIRLQWQQVERLGEDLFITAEPAGE